MKKLILSICTLLVVFQAIPWGKTGHRVVGLIAERHLSKKALHKIDAILQNESLAEVSNYMDFIRSDDRYNYMDPWHYATIPAGQTYEEAGTPEKGDIIQTIQNLITQLKTKQFKDGDEALALKMLVHLVGDIHQPLHIGNGLDKGGNDIKVEFYWDNSNLHRVWDSGIIDEQQYSYTEYTNWIDHATKSEIAQWQSDAIMVWVKESQSHLDQVYDFPESKKLNYQYNFKNRELVNQRLLKAGIRLAGILNEIYG